MERFDYPPCQSSSAFFVPLWIGDYKSFVAAMEADGRYERSDKSKRPVYLLPYAAGIYADDNLYSRFDLKKEHEPQLYMFQDVLAFERAPEVESIRISAFSTGCAFVEINVVYPENDLDKIKEFVFHFKKAKRRAPTEDFAPSLYDGVKGVLPSHEIEIFFTATDIKCECRMLHKLFSETPLDDETMERHLIQFRRGYNSGFVQEQNHTAYDMMYSPYRYDKWAGSQEGLVNICCFSEDESGNKFISKYKRTHWDDNYHFMYLLLLNQRFSAIKYVEIIATLNKTAMRRKEKLKRINQINERNTTLKTVFSFNVISDDLLYQNIYQKMYDLLDVDRLLADIKENEEQEALLQAAKAAEADKRTGTYIIILSLLSVASVLIDTASFLDRFLIYEVISTCVSVLIVLSFFLVYFFCTREK